MDNVFNDMFKNLSEAFNDIFGKELEETEPHEEFDSTDKSNEE